MPLFRRWAMAAALTLSACAAVGQPFDTSPIRLDIDDPTRAQVGSLQWRGGLQMRSTDAAFGGLSGLHVTADGEHLLAVSDRGMWFRADIVYLDGRLAGLRNASLMPIRDAAGRPVRGRDSDAEGLTLLPDGKFVVSFERRHRLAVFDSPLGNGRVIGAPPPDADMPDNGGIEALATLCDGRLLAIAEKTKSRQDFVPGWMGDGQHWTEFRYATVGGYRPTGATRLPNCDLLLVERSFSLLDGVKARIVRLPAAMLNDGSMATPVELARLEHPLTVDNFEGIAAVVGPDGETRVFLLSDDNFNAVQRNLLFMFVLAD